MSKDIFAFFLNRILRKIKNCAILIKSKLHGGRWLTQKDGAKNRISEAFITIIKEKNIDDISVTEIVAAADVGKSTFYRYYHDIYNVFEEIVDEFAQRILDVMLYLVFSDTNGKFDEYENTIAAGTAMALFGLKESDRIIVDYLFRTSSMKIFHLVVERFREIVRNYTATTSLDPEQADYYTKFLMNGILYSSLNDYREKGTINMELVDLLRSFSIGSSEIRSSVKNG